MKTLLGMLFPLFYGTLCAQTITLSGTVVNEKNKPIEQVNVYLDQRFDGALSDAKGYFTFTVQDSVVSDVLKFMHPQYDNMEVYIDTRKNYANHFVMHNREDVLSEIVVIAKSRNRRNQGESIGLNAMDVVSTAGSPGNIIGALSTMPGALVNGEDGRLLIRGGKAEESGIYVNGIKVFQPYTASGGTMPVRAKFNPFLFKGMSFSAGGYSAEFGDALSGVLQLDTADDIDPSRKDISISTVGVSFGQTQQWKKNSLSYTLNYLNLGAYNAVVKQRYNSKKPFNTTSGEVVYKRKIKNGGYKLYTAVDFTSMEYQHEVQPTNRVDTLAFKSNNVYLNSLYFKRISPYMRLDIGTGLGYSDYRGESNEKHIGKKNWDVNQKVKLSYQWNNKWQSFVGADVQVSQLELVRAIGKQEENGTATGTRGALFFENNWEMGSGLSWRAGVRVNQYSAISNGTIEPRTRLLYQVNAKQQIAFSYGIFNQAFNLEQQIDLKQEDWMQAHHYIWNYTYSYKKRMLRAEVFYKDYSKLLLTPKESPRQYTQLGKGYAKGIDVFWKDSHAFENFNYWITYTYIDSKRKEMDWDEWIQPSYVAKHNLSIVTKYWIEQWKSQVSMTYNFSSPRHFYRADSTNSRLYKSSPVHNVSMSWAYLISAQKILYASVDNLLGRNPVYAYQFSQKGGQPDHVGASAKRFVYIGLMWTISSDRKTNQLDNL